jgi:hypothetical protein
MVERPHLILQLLLTVLVVAAQVKWVLMPQPALLVVVVMGQHQQLAVHQLLMPEAAVVGLVAALIQAVLEGQVVEVLVLLVSE